MKILITGNMGYVGSVLASALRAEYPEAILTGFDSGYFAHCLTNDGLLPETCLDCQYFGDIRRFPDEILDGVDVVIHLAAISNDPMGKKYESVTNDINAYASARLAEAARNKGVGRFVFASSCSMYGSAEVGAKKENDELNPLTAYAKSKVYMENVLRELASDTFNVTSLRFSTACGMSPRLRLDLVLNDFVASAIMTGKIHILSDGTPWRPLIDVKDMARAIIWASQRASESGGEFVAVNVGRNDWNYQIKDLADNVSRLIKGSEVEISKDGMPDKRSYKVDFSLYSELASGYLPQVSLDQSIQELYHGLSAMKLKDRDFRESKYIRLKTLEELVDNNQLTPDLYLN